MPYVRAILHMIGSPNGWSICENGLGIFHILNEIWKPNPRLKSDVKGYFEGQIRDVVVRQILAKYKEAIRLYKGNELNIALEMTAKATFSIEEFYTEVQKKLKGPLQAEWVVVHHSTDTVDISPGGIDKGTGVLQVEEVTGIPISQTLGIGDSDGDSPMLNLVRYVGCPQNASRECKEIVVSKGGYVSPFSYAKGVANIIRRFTGASMN
ncbi:MAG: HAD hydrolase family protein [Patescibacteria group bacterium]